VEVVGGGEGGVRVRVRVRRRRRACMRAYVLRW